MATGDRQGVIEYELDHGYITLEQAERRIDTFTDLDEEERDALKLDAWARAGTRPASLNADNHVRRRWNVTRLLTGAHELVGR